MIQANPNWARERLAQHALLMDLRDYTQLSPAKPAEWAGLVAAEMDALLKRTPELAPRVQQRYNASPMGLGWQGEGSLLASMGHRVIYLHETLGWLPLRAGRWVPESA